MTIEALVAELSERGVTLWADGDQLRLRAPKAALTPELREIIAGRKAELLALLERQQAARLAALPLGPVPRDGDLPLSSAQERLWFLAALNPESAVYNLPAAFRLTGPLDENALSQSLTEIVRRHEVLRTSFPSRDGQPSQSIAPSRDVPVHVVNLQGMPDAAEEARRLADAEVRRPFDLVEGPLLRFTLIRLGEAEVILLLVLHHIISDGWSFNVLFRELGTLYGAFAAGRPSPLPELPIQYADFAEWQRRALEGETLEAQLAYWRRHLAGRLPVLDLPSDRPRPAVETYRGATHVVTVPASLSRALKALGLREGVTLFMTLLAAWKTLLHRYTDLDDVLVGSPAANRSRSEIEGSIGLFVNTLVLRTDLSGNPPFREVLERVRETALRAYANPDVPFDRLVEALHPERDLSRNPLFQVMFILQNASMTHLLELPGLTLEPLAVETGTSKFDLTLSLTETEPALQGTLEFNTALFDSATMGRLWSHFLTLLEGIAADPGERLWSLPVLPAAERHQIVVGWNRTAAPYARDRCLHQLLEEQAERTPDAVAVSDEDATLTYRELHRRADGLAHALRGLGVGPDVLVGICVERSIEMVVGLLGILKAGGAYVPLDPAYPSARLAFMLEDARIPVLVTQKPLLERLPPHTAHVLCLDTEWEALPSGQPGLPSRGLTPDHLAYVIYTSGSTGQPKGVLVPHRAVVNFLEAMRDRPGLTARSTLLAVTTLSFDIAALELYLPLLVGGRVALASRATAMDGALLATRLAETGATAMQATPATWRMLLDAGWSGHPSLDILCGGESLPSELAAELLARGASLWNLYGPTETTIWSTIHRVTGEERTIPVGRPIANTECYVLDREGQPAPVGVPGELHIGGVGVARGYWNRPELTTERFVPSPFGASTGARLYKTGDLVRYLPDGTIEHLGRLDQQVKVRGFRIELGEIEHALAQHPGVRQAVVVAREDAPGDRRLVAYVMAAAAAAPSVAEMQEHLLAILPPYMVPGIFVMVDALPLTPNGKVDRRALPAPEPVASADGPPRVGPRDMLELELTHVWQKLLAAASVGVRDNFFALGGHSLLAARLFAEIGKLTGRQLPLALIFQFPTVEGLARVLRDRGWSAPWSAVVPLQAGGTRPALFCVHQHTGHLFCYKDMTRHLEGEQPVYGLVPRGLDGQEAPRACIEEMAAHYVQEIRQLQPEGPYHLAGYCFGGIVAFEMAQQLQAAGQPVGLLAMLEASWQDAETSARFRQRRNRMRRRIAFEAAQLTRLRGSRKIGYLLGRARTLVLEGPRALLPRVITHWKEERGPAAAYLDDAIRRVEAAHWDAVEKYVPRVYPGRVTLFRPARLSVRFILDPSYGWAPLAGGGLDIVEIPGDRPTIVEEPGARILAEELRRRLSPPASGPP
ncbi:MAG: amino acid adenylation domain-containing protein [Candidatus Rokubacteria bacterium]|nr:amino acid adenylation domain-containing protein [Candidatus Rokubacteria bacterium]